MSQEVQYNVRDTQGNVYGPASTQMLRDWVREGRILRGMAIAPEGTDNWIEVSSHPSLVDLFEGTAAAGAAGTGSVMTGEASTVSATPVTPVTPVSETVTTPVGASGEPTNTPVVRAEEHSVVLNPSASVGARNHTLATVALIGGVLGIVSLVGICCCGGLNGIASTVFGAVGVVLGFVATRQIKAKPGDYSNGWMATVGIVCGGLAVLAGLGEIVAFIVAIVVKANSA